MQTSKKGRKPLSCHVIRRLLGSMCLAALIAAMLPVVSLAADKKVQAAGWNKGAGIAAVLGEKAEEDGKSAKVQETDKNQKAEEALNATDTVTATDSAESDDTALVMADVSNVLNVRTEPDSESELAGYLYADCGGEILKRQDGWTKLKSGELIGWAKDDYLLFGEEAKEAAKEAGRTVATTKTGALRIRKEPSADAGVYDLLEEGAEYEVVNASQLKFSDGIQISDEWVAVDYEGKTGFVSAEYVEVEFLIDHGETVEAVQQRKEEEERAARLAEEEKQKRKEKEKQEIEKAKAMESGEDVLLAALIQCEAGDEPYEGQVAVGAVVMNRVKSGAYPGTIRDVIFASGQFTPAGSGKIGRIVASGKVKASCLQAAQDAIAGVTPVGAATHFRRAGSREGIVIGHHVFW